MTTLSPSLLLSVVSHNFVAAHGQKAPGDVIAEMTSSSVTRCVLRCAATLSCTAVNVGPPGAGSAPTDTLCQLLDYGGFQGVTSMAAAAGWSLYVMLG